MPISQCRKLLSRYCSAGTWLVRVLAPPRPRRSSKALWGKKQHKQQRQTSSLPGCHLSRLLVPAAALSSAKSCGCLHSSERLGLSPASGCPAAASSFRVRGPSSQGLRDGDKAGGGRACPAGTRPTELERLTEARVATPPSRNGALGPAQKWALLRSHNPGPAPTTTCPYRQPPDAPHRGSRRCGTRRSARCRASLSQELRHNPL